MSDERAESRFANLGHVKTAFLRDSDDEEEALEPEPEPGPSPRQEVKTLVDRMDQLTVKTGTQEQDGYVCKAPPMYHQEDRSAPSPMHQTRPSGNRGVRPETRMAILRAISSRNRSPSSASNTDESHTSHGPESDFWPRRTSELVETWDKILKIDEENYMSRWNQDTELIRLTRRGDLQGLEKYQQVLGRSYRCMIEINTLNACFLSPLAIALYHGNHQAIRILLAMGARPDVRLSFGNNCFHIVAENDNQGVTLTCLLETCQELFSNEEFDKMLNSPNMFNSNPVDILYQRINQKPDMHQISVMITMMESHGARKRAGIPLDTTWFGPSTM